MEILFEDSDIVVCIKPTGVLSQSGNTANMPLLLKEAVKSEIYPVHRLDRQAHGLMVFAKTQTAAASLSKQIADHSFIKEYYAEIHGEPKEKSAVLEDLLFKDSRTNKVFTVKRMRKGVKKAKLEYTVKEVRYKNGEPRTLVRVRLYTGRTHQIRVQFASRSNPLSGDRRYGAKDDEKALALQSCRLCFSHPASGEMMNFEIEADV